MPDEVLPAASALLPQPPLMMPSWLAPLEAALATTGPRAAADALIEQLQTSKQYQSLFYALLLKARLQLGLSPFPNEPASELPESLHEPYEQAIRDAGRTVGKLYLDQNDLPKAWIYFRMLQEPEPVRQALLQYQPGPEEDHYPLVDLAWQQGLAPEKGFDWVLDRSGICSAITMYNASDFQTNPGLRQYCLRRLVKSLYEQLRERLQQDGLGRGYVLNPAGPLRSWLEAYPEFTTDDAYHIDTSHLGSVVSAATELTPGPELALARELAFYGSRLSEMHQLRGEPPFAAGYADYLGYLDILADVDRPAGLARFEQQALASFAEGYQYPVDVVIQLYLKVQEPRRALNLALKTYGASGTRPMNGLDSFELARRAGAYDVLAELALQQSEPVQWLAAAIAKQTGR